MSPTDNGTAKVIGVIPARWKSSRFPGKPLASILGRPMISWVYEHAREVPELDDVVVATDDKRIAATCEQLAIPCLMTGENCETGTDRVASLMHRIPANYYVNIQGDQPCVTAEMIREIMYPVITWERPNDYIGRESVSMGVRELQSQTELKNPDVVKVAVTADNYVGFMSRYPIPYEHAATVRHWEQVPVYCFCKRALEMFVGKPRGPNEKAEDIEMLRMQENHWRLRAVALDANQRTIGVDRAANIADVAAILKEEA